MFKRVDFDKRPIIVFWETTRSCPLACVHCRAEAILEPLPGELSTEEGVKFIESLTDFGRPYPLLIFTGGDPLNRRDLLILAERARDLGIPFALAPAVSRNLWSGILDKLADMGMRAVSISIDSPYPHEHDSIRGIQGIFDLSVKAVRYVKDLGVRIQINTVAMKSNVDSFPDMVSLIHRLEVPTWEVFFLIKVGRGRSEHLAELSAGESEDLVNFLYDASKTGIKIRTVEAPFIRRVTVMRIASDKGYSIPKRFPDVGSLYRRLLNRLEKIFGSGIRDGSPNIDVTPTRDGNGIIFVSYRGDVYPSGFTPYPVGNVRGDTLSKIYRGSRVLRAIRRAEFRGKCGVCEFRYICGGSRARAYAWFNDPLESDPACPYIPRGYGE